MFSKERLLFAFQNATIILVTFAISIASGLEVQGFAIITAVVINMGKLYGNSFHRGIMWMLGSYLGIITGLTVYAIAPQYIWEYAFIVAVLVFIFGYLSIADEYNGTAYIMGSFSFFTLAGGLNGDIQVVDTLYYALYRAEEITLAFFTAITVKMLLMKHTYSGQLRDTGLLYQKKQHLFYQRLSRGESFNIYDYAKAQRAVLSQYIQQFREAQFESNRLFSQRRQILSKIYYYKQLMYVFSGLSSLYNVCSFEMLRSRISNYKSINENIEALYGDLQSFGNSNFRAIAPEPTKPHSDTREEIFVSLYRHYLEQLQHYLIRLKRCSYEVYHNLPPRHCRKTPYTLTSTLALFQHKALISGIRLVFVFYAVMVLHLYIWGDYSSAVLMVMVLAFLSVKAFHYNPLKTFAGFNLGMGLGALFYIVVFVNISTWYALGATLFIYSFFIYLIYYDSPIEQLFAFFSLILFAISNHQTFHFLGYVNYFIEYNIAILLIIISKYFPISMRPEKSILSIKKRFFEKASSRVKLHFFKITRGLKRGEQIMYGYDLNTLRLGVVKLQDIVSHIDYSYYDKVDKELLQQFVEKCQKYYLLVEELEESDTLIDKESVRYSSRSLKLFKFRLAVLLKKLSLNIPVNANEKAYIDTLEHIKESFIQAHTRGSCSVVMLGALLKRIFLVREMVRAIFEMIEINNQIEWKVFHANKF